jgi:hypothetical protein
MNYVKLLSAAAILACLSVSAHGQEAGTNDIFKSWQSMQSYLATQGVDPLTIGWSRIEPLCQGLKMYSSESAYNKCSYEKALNMTLFPSDKSQCETQAKGTYPDSFLNGRTDTLLETDKNGVVHTYQRAIAAISAQDLKQLRTASVVECMQKLGWVNADDWRTGKRSTPCQ